MAPARKHTSRVIAWLCPPSQGMEVCKREECPLQAIVSPLSGSLCIALHLPPPPTYTPPPSLWVSPTLELQVNRRILFPPSVAEGIQINWKYF